MQQNRTFRSSSGWSGLYLILAMLIMSSYTGQKNPVDATIRQLQVQVLKFRQNNPVLQIKLSIPAGTPSQKVTAFSINTDGTEDLPDIKVVILHDKERSQKLSSAAGFC